MVAAMRRSFLPFMLAALSLAPLAGCGKTDTKKSTAYLKDFTKYDLLQFKLGSGLAASASRYDLTLSQNKLKRYVFTSTGYVSNAEYTMTAAQKSSLNEKLKKVGVQTWPSCSADFCATGDRQSVWIELTNISPAQYFFSYKGNCVCPKDTENAPTLEFTQMRAILDEVVGLLPPG